ncbi:MAG: SDR family NAD(P)-dependent oxidoreductase, partial [Hyphomicrobium sp.]|nr:SDR family NAD(P)-dependent oxidoreductase [Hyphomicrobium sp.]
MKLGPDIAAIVTGGASGLGHATASALRAAGVKVSLFDKNEEIGPEAATRSAPVIRGASRPAAAADTRHPKLCAIRSTRPDCSRIVLSRTSVHRPRS